MSMINVTISVDEDDLAAAKRIMDKLTEPSVPRPLTDEQVAYTLYLRGQDDYFESYDEDSEPES